jgi:hypothetical protein
LLAEIVRRPGDVENVLRLLLNQLRQVKVPSGKAEAEKELVMTAGKAHLDLLEQYRRLYLKSRALGSAQVVRAACALQACCWQAGQTQVAAFLVGMLIDRQAAVKVSLVPRVFLATLAVQRQRLYALDELEQCTMRIK